MRHGTLRRKACVEVHHSETRSGCLDRQGTPLASTEQLSRIDAEFLQAIKSSL
jgi:hypothetical protein